ncbi:MAG TPA: tail fiber domain-containing protein [Flavobacterium lutivivi]|nr:tail fiber domain-containing protein [Flavobacterium lutivivi]
MKKYLYILLIIPVLSLAQVGINTTTPAAQLEIKSSNQATPANTDGILIPKIDTFPVINPTAAQQGMMLYLTTTSGANQPGFYYWNNPGWVPIISGSAGGTLDQSYDFGGAGVGRTITADAGAVTINGTDGLVSIGISGSGAVAPTGAGVRMVWNPNKSAFRAGNVTGSQWNDANIGLNSVAFGLSTTASGPQSVALGNLSVASGNRSFAAGDATIASGIASTAFGSSSSAIGDQSIASGQGTIANGQASTSLGRNTIASGNSSLVSGFDSRAQSFGETVLGVGATNYTPSINGTTQWRAANSSDRLFVVGNAIDSNNNFLVDLSERSDAFVILKNGNTGIGSSAPQDKLHVVGNIRMVDGNQASGKVLTSDANGTATWQTPAAAGTTLDGAYNFGGAGAGRTITADTGAVTIAGTDGLVSTGTIGSGATAPAGAGTRMVWNPRKAAFRAGNTSGIQWDDANVGQGSAAFGLSTTAKGNGSFAFGGSNIANGEVATAFGFQNTAQSFAETVLGIGATNYIPLQSNNFTAPTDRLLVVGNAIDANNNAFVDAAERSDALIILRSGLTRLPSTTNAIITAADGKAVVTKEYLAANTSGTLDQAYNFGGAGAGRAITADSGAVTITGTDGFVSTGIEASGALAPIITGPTMYWNPRKSSFRAGLASANSWEDLNVGLRSTAFGENTYARGNNSIAWGIGNVADGPQSTAFGLNTSATGSRATAFGESSTASGTNSTAFGINSIASGDFATAFGSGCIANNFETTAFGASTTASGFQATAFGVSTTASGTRATAFGTSNTAFSFSETVIGIGATTYTTSGNGAIQFRATNATDRLFVIGNAIDANNNGLVDTAERSNAMVVLKNGNIGIGSSSPADKLHVVGNIRMVDGNQAAGKVLTSDVNGMATWQNASANAWGLVGNSGTNSVTNFIGTTDNQDLVFKRSNILSGRLGDANTFFGNGSGTASTGTSNSFFGALSGSLNATGDFNTFVGRLSGSWGISGSANTYLGYASGLNNTGSSNCMIGAFSGQSTSGNSNIFIGLSSGSTNTLGSRNVLLGESADVAVNNLTNAIAIGSRAEVGTSNSLVLGSVNGFNGATSSVNVGIGTTIPADRLHVVGNIRMVDGNQAAGKVLTSDANGTATWQNASANAWGLTGNTGTSAATNYLGTNDDIDLILKRFNTRAGRIGTNNTSLGVNALNTAVTGASNTAIGVDALKSATTGTNNTAVGQNALGSINGGSFNTAIGAEATTSSTIFTNATAIGSRALAGNSNVLVLGSINGVNGATNSVNVGIGTTIPQTKLEIVDGNKVTSNTGEGNLHVVSNNPQNTDIGGSISLGGFGSSTTNTSVFATVEGRKSNAGALSDSGYLIFKTNNVGALTECMRITNTGDIGIGTAVPGGQFELSLNEGRKPGTNTWTIVSDQRLKTINGSYTKGLNEILQLNPVRFNYKNNGERTFEKEVLETEFAGFIAQEVQPLFPDAVGTDKDGFLNFNIHPILIASVNALKELNEKNTSLREENEVLKQAVEEMRQQIELIKSEIEKLKQ